MSAHETLLIRLPLGSSPLRKTPDVGIKADIGPDQRLRLVERQRTADRQAGGNGALAEPVDQRNFGLPAQIRVGEPRSQCVDAVLGDYAVPIRPRPLIWTSYLPAFTLLVDALRNRG